MRFYVFPCQVALWKIPIDKSTNLAPLLKAPKKLSDNLVVAQGYIDGHLALSLGPRTKLQVPTQVVLEHPIYQSFIGGTSILEPEGHHFVAIYPFISLKASVL